MAARNDVDQFARDIAAEGPVAPTFEERFLGPSPYASPGGSITPEAAALLELIGAGNLALGAMGGRGPAALPRFTGSRSDVRTMKKGARFSPELERLRRAPEEIEVSFGRRSPIDPTSRIPGQAIPTREGAFAHVRSYPTEGRSLYDLPLSVGETAFHEVAGHGRQILQGKPAERQLANVQYWQRKRARESGQAPPKGTEEYGQLGLAEYKRDFLADERTGYGRARAEIQKAADNGMSAFKKQLDASPHKWAEIGAHARIENEAVEGYAKSKEAYEAHRAGLREKWQARKESRAKVAEEEAKLEAARLKSMADRSDAVGIAETVADQLMPRKAPAGTGVEAWEVTRQKHRAEEFREQRSKDRRRR